MTFEVYNADLETEAGIESFKTVYKALVPSDRALEFQDVYLEGWARDSPEKANHFLRSLITDESPHLRELAGSYAYQQWYRADPELASDVLCTLMMDEDPIARSDYAKFIPEALTGDSFHDWLQVFGIPRIERLLEVARQSRERYPEE